MSIIEIVKTPPGEAPLWVRKRWVGVKLWIDENAPDPDKGTEIGIRGGKAKNSGGYPVQTYIAIETLAIHDESASIWWTKNVRLDLIPRFVFAKDVCQVLPDSDFECVKMRALDGSLDDYDHIWRKAIFGGDGEAKKIIDQIDARGGLVI